MEKQEYKKRYSHYQDEVRDTVNILIDNTEMSPEFVVQLDLFAMNLDLMYTAKKDIEKSGSTLESGCKNPSVQVYNNALQVVLKISNQFSTSPMSKAKISKLNMNEISGESLLDEFLKE